MVTLEISCLVEDPLNAVPRAIDEIRRGGHRLSNLTLSEANEGRSQLTLVAVLNASSAAFVMKEKILGVLRLTGRANNYVSKITP